jgi:hypothetical protein
MVLLDSAALQVDVPFLCDTIREKITSLNCVPDRKGPPEKLQLASPVVQQI